MTQKSIEEMKFEEAKKLIADLKAIATFNENITCAVNVSFKDGTLVNSATVVAGEKEDLLSMYKNIAETLAYEFMKNNDFSLYVFGITEAAIEGAFNGYNKFKQEAKETTDENN
ncbi:hypothetical protein FRG77_08075 [Listeria monocytogenes]|nr:hypothetical protein [Listeria monocytogenes]EAF5440075.1 hypothetical protein [Listeria monocytogenes]ECK4904263.1 hypothetical protein [Listeria monocytogenes]